MTLQRQLDLTTELRDEIERTHKIVGEFQFELESILCDDPQAWEGNAMKSRAAARRTTLDLSARLAAFRRDLTQ